MAAKHTFRVTLRATTTFAPAWFTTNFPLRARTSLLLRPLSAVRNLSSSQKDNAQQGAEQQQQEQQQSQQSQQQSQQQQKQRKQAEEAGKQASATFERISSLFGEATDDLLKSSSSVRYGGLKSREERAAIRKQRELKAAATKAAKQKETPMEADPSAGTGIVMHKESSWKEAWNKFRDNNKFVQGIFELRNRYEDSDNIVVHYLKRIQDSIGSFFAETEHAQTIKQIKEIDPSFNLESFLKEMHEFMIPEVLEAYLSGDLATLRLWCSDSAYNVMRARLEETLAGNLVLDSKVLNLRHVELAMAQLIDERPVLLVTFNTQQLTIVRDQSGKIVSGKEDDISSVYYVFAVMKKELDDTNALTNGWILVDLAVQNEQKVW